MFQNPCLKGRRLQRFKLRYHDPLSNFGFEFNLRRFSPAYNPHRHGRAVQVDPMKPHVEGAWK